MILKSEWISQFATQFLASYAANIYDEACIRNQHQHLYDLPVEDAFSIAEKMWDKFKEKYWELEEKSK